MKIPPYKWKEIDDEAFRRRKYRQMAMKNSVTENIENGDEKFRPANKKKLTMKHSVAENIDKWRWKIPSQKIQINGDETFRPKNKKKSMKHSVSKNNQKWQRTIPTYDTVKNRRWRIPSHWYMSKKKKIPLYKLKEK